MKVCICLASPDAKLSSYFSKNEHSSIPKDARNRGFFKSRPATFSAISWIPGDRINSDEFERFFVSRLSRFDAVAILVDEQWLHVTENIRSAAFVVRFDSTIIGNMQNAIQSISAKSIKQLGQILAKFDRGDDSRLLTLPVKNFDGDDLRELVRICEEDNLNPEFARLVEDQLVLLRRRERPRRRSSYKHVYAVDDRLRFFRYGIERHSRFATGGKHRPFCEIKGSFRFGRKIDTERHYNVSETEGDRTAIQGDFTDCHGVHHPVKDNYLNMFSNDYFGYEERP